MNVPIRLVLDTNIVLDWWLFDDPHLNLFRCALRDNRTVVVRSPLVVEELRRVLAYPKLRLDIAKQAQVLAAYESHSIAAELPATFSLAGLLLPSGFPHCDDPDDQHFLALAYHTAAHALVTRDAAVLRTQRRAERFGVNVIGVERMNAMFGT